MNHRELKELIEEGEGSKIEFKRKLKKPKKIAKEVAAFANSKGGYIIIGVDDDGTYYGVRSEKIELELMKQACEFFIEPRVDFSYDIFQLGRHDILLVEIEESKVKPHFVLNEEGEKENAYIRMGEHSVSASKEMIRLMRAKTIDKPVKIVIGQMEKRLFAYLDNHDRITVNEFAKLVNISRRRSERLLIRLVRAQVLQIHNDSHHDYFTYM